MLTDISSLYTQTYTNRKLNICYSTPRGVPVPSISPLFTDSLSSSPVTTQKEQTHRYVYTEIIAKSISPKTSTKGATELLSIRVHTLLEVVLKSRCLKRWWYLEHWRLQEAIRRKSPHATLLTRSPDINFQNPSLGMSKFTSNKNNSYRNIID